MAEIKLFDTWTFQEEMPEPFSQFLKKKDYEKLLLWWNGFPSIIREDRQHCIPLH